MVKDNEFKVIYGVQFELSHIVDVKQVSCMSGKKIINLNETSFVNSKQA